MPWWLLKTPLTTALPDIGLTMATKAGMIGITGTNARPSIAPTFGVENMLGTNPLTVGMPTDEDFPFMLDCATSITQRGKIEYYARNGQPTPAGMVIGRNGEALTDSAEILSDLTSGAAALAPLGGIGEELAGYKGYGYATVVEILSAALSAGNFLKMLTGKDSVGNAGPYHLGHFFLVIDPEAFMGLDAFKKTCGDILRELRASQKAPGHDRIYTAGEKEYLTWLERKDKGVPLGEAVQKELIEIRDTLGLPHVFPFEKKVIIRSAYQNLSLHTSKHPAAFGRVFCLYVILFSLLLYSRCLRAAPRCF